MASSPISISSHPVLISKVSQLRSTGSDARAVRLLIQEIATFLAYEATNKTLALQSTSEDTTPVGSTYALQSLTPTRICLVPVLRSGLGMTNAFLSYLPASTEVHHLGLFREEHTLNAVEYYNKLPRPSISKGHIETAFIVDPVIATGNTACAAVQIMREWGVKKVVFCAVLASRRGLDRVKQEWPEGVEFFIGCVDEHLNEKGYIVPGLGDVGDRMFSTTY